MGDQTVSRPDEATQLRETFEQGLPPVLLGCHLLGKRTLLQHVVRTLDGSTARILWGDLCRPDPECSTTTYRRLFRGLLLGARSDLRAQADRIESHQDGLDLLEEAALEQCTVMLKFTATTFNPRAFRTIDPLVESWTTRRRFGGSLVPRLVMVAELLERDWWQLAGGHVDFGYLSHHFKPVELRALSDVQVGQLLNKLGLGEPPREGPLRVLLDRLCGHPYLLNLALMPLAARESTAERLLAAINNPRGPLAPYFQQMHAALSNECLLDDARGVTHGDEPLSKIARATFRSWGVSMPGDAPDFPVINEGFRYLFGRSV